MFQVMIYSSAPCRAVREAVGREVRVHRQLVGTPQQFLCASPPTRRRELRLMAFLHTVT